MTDDPDPKFFDRADAVIAVANSQLPDASRGRVSASLMYATARFNAWISALGSGSATEMSAARADTIDYFVGEYRKMLEENLDDHIANFDKYMRGGD